MSSKKDNIKIASVVKYQAVDISLWYRNPNLLYTKRISRDTISQTPKRPY